MRHLKFLLLPAVLLLAGSAMAAGTGVITSITPNVLSNSSGGSIIIRGAGFTGATKVIVNGVTITGANFTFLSDKKVTAVVAAQAGALGNVAVDVQNAGGTLLSGTGTLTFVANQLQISARAFIAGIISVTWGNGTVADSAGTTHFAANVGDTTPYVWVIGSASSADAGISPVGPPPAIGLSGVYYMSDDYMVTVRNTSNTGTKIYLSAQCTDTNPVAGDWTLGAVAPDTFAMAVALDGGAQTFGTGGNAQYNALANSATPSNLNPAAGSEIKFSGDRQVDLKFSAPSSITKGADTQETMTVTLTAFHG